MVLPLQCGSRSAARLLLKWAGAPNRRRAILKRAARGRRLFIPRKDLDQVGRWARAHQGIFSIPWVRWVLSSLTRLGELHYSA
jgi:hypothetical protein